MTIVITARYCHREEMSVCFHSADSQLYDLALKVSIRMNLHFKLLCLMPWQGSACFIKAALCEQGLGIDLELSKANFLMASAARYGANFGRGVANIRFSNQGRLILRTGSGSTCLWHGTNKLLQNIKLEVILSAAMQIRKLHTCGTHEHLHWLISPLDKSLSAV